MDSEQHLDDLLEQWPYDPSMVSVRTASGRDGRQILQMRVEMGVLQMEILGRPDGMTPEGFQTYLDHLLSLEGADDDDFELDEDQCGECDREFVMFYHRRVCWLALKEYSKAAQDARHTLALMDLCKRHSPDEDWTLTHEQYRPFVLYHCVQANALAHLSDGSPDDAVHSINEGLDELKQIYVDFELEEEFEDDELVQRLVELRESMRSEYEVGLTLQERLESAIVAERYEDAARLRDELANRRATGGR